MRVLSKKHKPIKAYRKYGKAAIIVWYIVGIVVLCLLILSESYVYLIGVFPLFLWICWVLNADFEIYDDCFAVGYSFVLLPCKLVVKEVFFDAIGRIDSRVGHQRWGEIYTMIIHCKDGSTKEREFKGSNMEFNEVLYNWKEIANYETRGETAKEAL